MARLERDDNESRGLSGRAALRLGFGVALAIALLLAVDHLLRPETFPVRSVMVEGSFRHVDQAQLVAAVSRAAAGSILLLDLNAVRAGAEAQPWVYRASVRRRWPDAIYVSFTEQQLAARWNGRAWLNVQGDVVELGTAAGDSAGDKELPRLSGPDGNALMVLEQYRRFSGQLAAVGLRVTDARLTDRHSWELNLDNGLQLLMGHDDANARLERFAQVYQQALASQVERIRQVDLRYTNGFAVEWLNRTGATPSRREG